jgi:hypothetical protein
MTDAPLSGQREETCRICLESSAIANSNPGSVSRFTDVADEDRLISPCACSGTQAYVHYKCLQRWQQSVMASKRTSPGLLSPALICSVCTHKFSVAPPRPTVSFRMRKICTSYACEVTGIIIILLACYVALAGHNLQTLIDDFENGLSLAIEVLPCSLQMKVLEDGCNSRTCNTFKMGAGGGILQVLCTLARSWWRLQPCYLLTTLALWCCYMSTKGAEVLEGLYSTSSQRRERFLTGSASFSWESRIVPL